MISDIYKLLEAAKGAMPILS